MCKGLLISRQDVLISYVEPVNIFNNPGGTDSDDSLWARGIVYDSFFRMTF